MASATKLIHITKELIELRPTSRQAMRQAIEGVLKGSIDRVIDTHNTTSILFIFMVDSATYVMKAEYGNNVATTREIDWYLASQGGPMPMPRLFATWKGCYAFLITGYIEQAQTLDTLVAKYELSAVQTGEYIYNALSYNKRLFNESMPANLPASQVDEYFIKRYEKRLAEAQKFNYLKDLLEDNALTINDRQRSSVATHVAKIRDSPRLHKLLTPQRVGLIHGDLHCGNILIGTEGMFFVDPNSARRMPLEYDYGKILHSIHGGYHSILEGEYELANTGSKYSLSIIIPEAYIAASQAIRCSLTDVEYLQSLYAEAMHFACMLPHHAAHEEETTVLYLRAVEIFSELFYSLSIK